MYFNTKNNKNKHANNRLGPRSSSRGGFKKLDILTVPSLYIFALMMFVVRNPDNLHINPLIQSTETRQIKINYIYHQ
jgi:hypothetical protein